jgi:hypothetical protein
MCNTILHKLTVFYHHRHGRHGEIRPKIKVKENRRYTVVLATTGRALTDTGHLENQVSNYRS